MKGNLLKRVLLAVSFFMFFLLHPDAQPYYVAVNGNDDNDGTEGKPFKTIEKAISLVQPGETIYVRGGRYELLSTISVSESGRGDAMITLKAYPGERPILDFSGQELGGSNRGIMLTGNYWFIRGFDITGAGDNGMKIEGGSNNIIENCAFYRNRDSGLQIDNGASNNTITNCDSYYNADPPDYGDADGFAAKLNVGSGNSFYGCRAWKNCDDGWDGYLRGADDVSTMAENCWAFENGYLEDGTNPGSQANGNGFKMGGSDDQSLRHNYTLKNCLAFKNKAKGFDQNHDKGSMILYNCTGHNNLDANYRITEELAAGKVLIVKNCLELGGTADIGSFAEQEKNSWLSPFEVTAADFVSLNDSAAYGPRQEDGSLPDISYMHLAEGSDLIDAGVDVGLPYSGSAPDLGCFESVYTVLPANMLSENIRFYPNPVQSKGFVQFNPVTGGRYEIKLYDVTGRFVKILADENMRGGKQQIEIDVSGVNAGVYICRITLDKKPLLVNKLIIK